MARPQVLAPLDPGTYDARVSQGKGLDAQVTALAGFSTAAGLFFRYYLARKASLLDPVEALRSQWRK